MKAVVVDKIALPDSFNQKLKQLGVIIYEDMPKDTEDLIKRMEGAEIITANYVDITKVIIDASPELKFVIVPAVGLDWVDASYAASKGIKVINCPTFNTHAVAELAFALILSLCRPTLAASESLKQSEWLPKTFSGTELRGKKLGLIGHGNIGQAIEKIAGGFDMPVSFSNSKSTAEEIDQLVVSSDILVICAALNDSTRHMIDERRLGLMKDDAFIVNVARGAIVDQAALLSFLKQGKFAGVGLDVFEGEPSGTSSANETIVEIAKLPRVLATPHIGYNTEVAVDSLGQEIYDNIAACMEDKPINVVN